MISNLRSCFPVLLLEVITVVTFQVQYLIMPLREYTKIHKFISNLTKGELPVSFSAKSIDEQGSLITKNGDLNISKTEEEIMWAKIKIT